MICLGMEGTAHSVGIGIVKQEQDKCLVFSNLIDSYKPEKGGIHPREAANHHAEIIADLIKESVKMVREAWRKAHNEIQEKAAREASGKIGGTLVKIEQLNTKLERTVEQLKAKGYDTTPIETMSKLNVNW